MDRSTMATFITYTICIKISRLPMPHHTQAAMVYVLLLVFDNASDICNRNLKLDMLNLGWSEHHAVRMDSDLEAFSHNPTDDSIATIAAQLIAFTMYLNEVFLSY